MADKEVLNKQLLDTIHSMKQEGLVDEQFVFVYSLKENNGDPFYLADLISEFCSDARDVLKHLTRSLNKPVLKYDLMRDCVYKVKGSALSLGACRMAVALTNLERAIEQKSKEECLMALNGVKHEYSTMERKLHLVLQLERRLVVLSTQGTNNI